MNPNEKKEILKSIDEKELRQDLIIPLLSKMGYLAPIEYHGTKEKGKDIICFEYDRLNEQRFLAVVAKKGDLTGSASSNAGLMNVVNQIQQAFDNPYEDLYNMRQIFINEVWVITSGEIVSGAQESVINTLRKTNLDKQIRIIGNDRLVQLIDKHFSTYWNSSSETKESVIIQRDRLLTFIGGLLAANNVDKATIESVKSTILYSSFNTSIHKNIEGLHISSVSPYSIELAKIEPEYDDYIYSKVYGITREVFQAAKKELSYSFFEIEETIDYANKLSKLTNPEEFVIEYEKNLKNNYPFYRPYYNSDASKFIDHVSSLEEGLNELKYFKRYLKYHGKLDWAKDVSKSITDLLPEIEKIIENGREDEIIINFIVLENERRVKIEYDGGKLDISFTLRFSRVEEKGFRRNKDGTLKPTVVLNFALSAFRGYVEKLLNYDEAAWLSDYVE